MGASRVPRLRDESASLVRPDLLAFRNAFSMRPFLTKRLLSRLGARSHMAPLSLSRASGPASLMRRARSCRTLPGGTAGACVIHAHWPRRLEPHVCERHADGSVTISALGGDAHFHLCPLVRARARPSTRARRAQESASAFARDPARSEPRARAPATAYCGDVGLHRRAAERGR